jgi:ABC-type nitrate/sulfonate/bicarbonate transport system substrate-binding protein
MGKEQRVRNGRQQMRTCVISLVLCALLFALSFTVEAQQPKKVYRLGYLSPRLGIDSVTEAFRQRLRELGYIEGQNLAIEWRFAKGKSDLNPELAAGAGPIEIGLYSCCRRRPDPCS